MIDLVKSLEENGWMRKQVNVGVIGDENFDVNKFPVNMYGKSFQEYDYLIFFEEFNGKGLFPEYIINIHRMGKAHNDCREIEHIYNNVISGEGSYEEAVDEIKTRMNEIDEEEKIRGFDEEIIKGRIIGRAGSC